MCVCGRECEGVTKYICVSVCTGVNTHGHGYASNAGERIGNACAGMQVSGAPEHHQTSPRVTPIYPKASHLTLPPPTDQAPLLRSPRTTLYLCHGLLRCTTCCCRGLAVLKTKQGQLTHNIAVQEATRNDELYWGWKINASFVMAMVAGSKEALASLDEVKYPFLVMHSPDADAMSAVSGSRELFSRATSARKTIEEARFAGEAHELHNAEYWQAPLEVAEGWMRAE